MRRFEVLFHLRDSARFTVAGCRGSSEPCSTRLPSRWPKGREGCTVQPLCPTGRATSLPGSGTVSTHRAPMSAGLWAGDPWGSAGGATPSPTTLNLTSALSLEPQWLISPPWAGPAPAPTSCPVTFPSPLVTLPSLQGPLLCPSLPQGLCTAVLAWPPGTAPAGSHSLHRPLSTPLRSAPAC